MKNILILIFLTISTYTFSQVDTLDGARRDWQVQRGKINNNDLYLESRVNDTIQLDSVMFNGGIQFLGGIKLLITADSAYITEDDIYQYNVGKKE